MGEREETLKQYANDMIGIERYIRDAAGGQLDDNKLVQFTEAQPVVRQLKATLDEHVRILEQHVERLGGEPTKGVKEAVTSAFGNIIEMFQKGRSEEVSKMLRDHYTALSLS